MSRPGLFLALVVCVVLAGSHSQLTVAGEQPPPASVSEALAAPSRLEFVETSLGQIADFLANRHSINVVLDVRALRDIGLGAETPVTFALRNASLETALGLMLARCGLTFSVEENVLLITTPERAEDLSRTVVYDVDDLLEPPEVQQAYEHVLDELIETIVIAASPESWEDIGGRGSIRPFGRSLAIYQTDRVHREIAPMLGRLAEACRSKPGETPPPDEFERALDKAVTFDFNEVPLVQVADFLANATGLDVYVDEPALYDADLGDDLSITGKGENIAVRVALDRWLEPLGLALHREEDVLVITTREEAATALSLQIYNVADIITPEGADPNDEALRDYDGLASLMLLIIAPETWDEVGGVGALAFFRGHLTVLQSYETHQEIARFLAVIRKSRDGESLQNRDVGGATIREQLRQSATVSFHETPLGEAADFLGRQYNLPIVVDVRALDDVGFDGHEPVSLRVSRVPLQTVLDLVLQSLDLTWTVRGEAVLITTPEKAEGRLRTECYPIHKLVDVHGQSPPTAEDLIEIVTTTVAPETWNDVGGRGSIGMYRNVLVVSQTDRVQEKIARLLKDLSTCADR